MGMVGLDRPVRREAQQPGQVPVLEDPGHHAKHGPQRQDVHHDRLHRQDQRAEREEHQPERRQDDGQRHPRQGLPEAGQLVGQRGGLPAGVGRGAGGRGDVADLPGDSAGLRRVEAGAVGHVDPGDVAVDARELRAGDAGNVVQAADVRGEGGGAAGRAGDRPGELDDGLDGSRGVAGEVGVQRLGDDAGRGAGRQHGGVGPPQTTFRNGEARPSSTTTIGTAYRTGRRITLCASRYHPPLPSAAGGRCTERRIRSEFTFGPEDGQQRGQHGQRGEHVDQRRWPPRRSRSSAGWSRGTASGWPARSRR